VSWASQFQLLYAIERRAADQQLHPEQVLQLRREEAVPILEGLGKWMHQNYIEVLPKAQ